jgi:NhaP-type Na+/H+ or K+/H+ antiporter
VKALAYGALLGLLWILFPSAVTLAAAVALAALVKAIPPALLLALLARTVPSQIRRWAR